MSIRMATSSIFRASALSTQDDATGTTVDWLEEGVHLRVKVSPWIGFPLHPFAAWRLDVNEERQEVPVLWQDREGHALLMPFDLENAGGEAVAAVMGATPDDPWIWVELEVDERGVRIDLLDGLVPSSGEDRVVATRRQRPFRFGHTQINHLRMRGAGTVLAVRGFRLSHLVIDRMEERPPDLVFGLPLPEQAPDGSRLAPGPWYAPDPNIPLPDAAAVRLFSAAPRRLAPPDNPQQSLPDSTDPTAEADRIVRAIAPAFIDPWLADAFNKPDVSPTRAVREESSVTALGQELRTGAPVTPTLMTMAVDPQIARYLGLATFVGYGETDPVQEANVWVIASRWAVQRQRIVLKQEGLIDFSLALDVFLGADMATPATNDRLDEAFPDAPALIADMPGRFDPDDSGAWSVVTLMAVAVAAGGAPPDAPDPFNLSAAEPGAWNAAENPPQPGVETWRQQISLGLQPARGMVGFARMAPGDPVALHRLEPPPGNDVVTRALPLVPNWSSNNQRLVTDRLIPPAPGGADWQVWQADEFGQWSSGAKLHLPLPLRPKPPPPVLESIWQPDANDGSTGPRIPGHLRLRYEVPTPAHAAPGSLTIVELRITVDGVAQQSIAVSPGQIIVHEVSPSPFQVGEHRNVPVESSYVDSDGALSEPSGHCDCAAFDARPPRSIPTSPLLVWTGQSDTTGQSELALSWPPRSGAARFRIYLGDARRLAGVLGLALSDSPVRSSQAKPIHGASSGLTNKTDFTFLGEVSGTPAADGRIHYATRVPGSLRSVQFVRIVPLTQGGAEADFSTCQLVPVAVPMADRPPPPLLDAAIDVVDGLRLTLRAPGLRSDVMASAPGGSPEFRLRRTRRNSADRQYVPVLQQGVLVRDAADAPWSAEVRLPLAQLDPFVRTYWLAEVRYPDEPPLPPGFVAEPVAGGVESEWSAHGASSAGLWSDLSLSAESLLIPPDAPSAPEVPTMTIEPGGAVTLGLSGLPIAHPAAIARNRLEIYRGAPGKVSTLLLDAEIQVSDFDWSDAQPVADAHYDVLLVDPVGRRSVAVRVVVA